MNKKELFDTFKDSYYCPECETKLLKYHWIDPNKNNLYICDFYVCETCSRSYSKKNLDFYEQKST